MTFQTDAPGKNEPINGAVDVPPSLPGRSPLGIASIIIGIINPVLFLLNGYFSFRGMPMTLIRMLEFAMFCVVPILWLVGLILASIGLSRQPGKKTIPIVGLILNLLYLCPLAFSIFGFFIGR
jgi:hypothetical protein